MIDLTVVLHCQMITLSAGNLICVNFSFFFRAVASVDAAVMVALKKAVLPLDEAVASRAVVVIVTMSDGRAGARIG